MYKAQNNKALIASLDQCLTAAHEQQIDVLILPELALILPEADRKAFLARAEEIARQENRLIITGSFFDKERYNRSVIVTPPEQTIFGYKMKPSIFEVSTLAGKGMTPGRELYLLKTEFGNIMVVTCVDLISDEVQYVVRHLATTDQLDVLVNINYNPAAKEFLVEANSLARRHPLFVTLTNVSSDKKNELRQYGHTSIFADLDDWYPKDYIERLPADFTEKTSQNTLQLQLPFDHLVGDIRPANPGF